ncbi:MAG: hypothetical protein K2J13_04110, partial [Clostridia bacterium]|nr:hypothetical protein [Clostridia bacterium]
GKRYVIKLDFIEDEKYYINIYYPNVGVTSSGEIPAEVMIYLPKKINSAKLLPENSTESITILENRNEIKSTIYMGRTYTLQVMNSANESIDIFWDISPTSGVQVYIDGYKLLVKPNQEYESITLVLKDSLGIDLTVTLALAVPYKSNATIDVEKDILITSPVNNDNANVNNDANITKIRLEDNSGNSTEVINGDNYTLFEMFEDGLEIFKNGAKIKFSVYIELNNGCEYWYMNDEGISPKFLKMGDIKGDLLSNKIGVIIDTRDTQISNTTYEVPGETTKLFLFGNRLETLNNVRFIFAAQTMYLYLLNYKVNANNTVFQFYQGDADSPENNASANIMLFGENKITGSSGDYLVKANKIIFSGNQDASLEIIGANGANGANGKTSGGYGESGKNGTSALSCTVAENLHSCKIILQGGNGGDGGKGLDGAKGTDYSYNYSQSKGGDGGNGGMGGRGGEAGTGCSVDIGATNIIIKNGKPGCGGNGGNGGLGGEGSDGLAGDNDGELITLKAYRGGNGGDGGSAGACGSGDHDCKMPKGGNGGNGGPGGQGASAQKGSKYVYTDPGMGGDGGNGGLGCIGGDGGNGGWGGDGAKGKNATLTSNGGDGCKGAKGGDGGNGGNYNRSDIGRPGNPGQGGNGGDGGEGGDKKSVFKGGAQGESGDSGSPGNPGVYQAPGTSSGGSSSGSCVALGTLITLADGRQVPVESLTGNETLLVWNMFTGKFDVAQILFIDSEPEREYEVINLYFSDGISVKVIDEHGFWDFNLNKYVFLRNDAAQYIGHWFNKQTIDEDGNLAYTRVQLTDVVVQTEYTSAWSPVTYGHLCYYVNGMLSMPGATTGLINIFDVNPDTMTIDEESYLADIQKYGLFTYEEFAETCAIPEMVFEAFGGKYLKVAIGKGLTTFEELESLIARYSAFWETNL